MAGTVIASTPIEGTNETRTLEIVSAEHAIDQHGSPANFTLSLRSFVGAGLSRRDWSQINFQYWSIDGQRNADPQRSDFFEMYKQVLRAENNGETTGMCLTIIDDASFWATVKVWTGDNGNNLGNCECSSLDYPNIWGTCN